MRSLLQIIIVVSLVWARTLVQAQSSQTVENGRQTQPIVFSPGCLYNWMNNKPGIGLPARGTGDIAPFTAINTGTTPIVATIKAIPVLTSYAYIANQGSNKVTVVDGTTHAAIKSIDIGGTTPVGVTASADGKRVYIANNVSNNVSVISTADNTLVTTIPVGNYPFGIIVSPDGSRVYVANQGDYSISVIDTQSNAVIGTIPGITTVSVMCVSPDGKWIYAATESGGADANLYIINSQTYQINDLIPINEPENDGMVISPDGNTIYITNNLSNSVTIVNLVTKVVVKIRVGSDLTRNSGPYGIAINAAGTRLYVACSYQKEVDIINTATNAVIKTVSTTGGPFTVSVSSNDKEFYVTNRSANAVDVFNSANYSKLTTIRDPGFDAPVSLGNFISKGPDCHGSPIALTITVKPTTPTIIAGPVTGSITACLGTASASPDIQQFTVSGNDLTTGIKATAPAGFQVSLSTSSGYGSSVLLNRSGGKVTNVVVYVRSAATATSNITDNVVLTSTGAAARNVAVARTINALPTVDKPVDPIYTNGDATTAINFTGTGTKFTWTNDKPGIGLPANGTGNISSFTAVNKGNLPIIASIKVTPANATGCPGIPATFIITVNKQLAVITTSGIAGNISACAGFPSVTPNIQKFTVSGAGLTANITATAPTGFEVSLSANGGFGNAVTLNQSTGKVTAAPIYVRSAASAPASPISGKVVLTSGGATSQNVTVDGIVNALPTVSAIGNKTYKNGEVATAINFAGTGNIFKWVNDTPAIGLAASGTGDIAPFTAVNTGAGTLTATVTVTPESSTFAYIINGDDNNVSVINTLTHALVTKIPVGQAPTFVTVSPDGRRVYVVNNGSNSISVINTGTNKVVTEIPVGSTNQVIVSPDNKFLYVTDYTAKTIRVINIGAFTEAAPIPLSDQPSGVAINPAGSKLYISNSLANTVSVIDIATKTIIATINVNSQPQGIIMSPDGLRVYVTNFYSNSISVINTATNNIDFTISQTRANPDAVAISADGSKLYVANFWDGSVSIINTATNAISATIATGANPSAVDVSADGAFIYVTNQGANNMSVISTATNSVIATIPTGASPKSQGKFIVNGTGCAGVPVTFTIKVNVQPPVITTGPVTGTITACAGSPSASPDIQQFTVSGSDLSGDITASATTGFQVSLSAGNGFANSVLIAQANGIVNSTVVYVRSANNAIGNILGHVNLATPGFAGKSIAVSGFVNALPIVNAVGNQTKTSGESTNAVTFTGTGDTYTWTNDKPGIGLPASGSGNIQAFTAVNSGTSPVAATITVTPSSATTGCDGKPVSFTITIDALPPPVISNSIPPNGVNTIYGTPSEATSFTVSGQNMREGIKITPPAGVEVSTDNINFSNTITVGAAGTITLTTIYVRLAKTTPAGPYGGPITLTSAGASAVSADLPVSIVSRAPLTVTAANKSKDYGKLLTAASGSIDFTVSGLQNSETAAAITTTYGNGAAANAPVGNYTGSVTPSALTGGTFDVNNYVTTYVNADIIINKVPLTIIADNKTKKYKDPDPILTITYNGFVNGESPAQLTSLPIVSTIADETSIPGTYPIIVSGGVSPNYTIALINGELTVLGVNAQLRIPNTFTPNGDGVNDIWNIVNIDNYPACTVNIYNRWGQRIFSSIGYGKSWDGKYKGTLLPVNTYYYIIDLKNESKPYSGSITIIR